jgi:arginyl-tRNA synthetase
MVSKLKEDGFAYESEGALVVDVTEETDKKEIPPCIIVKSNGATLYATTDLATIVEREKLFRYEQNSEKTSRPGMRECPLHYLSWQNGFRQRYGE